jgi:aminoglycoside phosphotransferase (APT) family kinase protein
MSDEPGRLLASGRAADVYDLGDGSVLRRYRTDRDCADEARLMIWLGTQDVAVPTVHRAAGRDIVMDRVAGPTMVEDLGARPWRIVRHARELAKLQRALHEHEAPGWLPVSPGVTDGDRVLHLDLHPMNVILADGRSVIIDWTNASRGDPSFDAAMTYVLMASFEATGLAERIGRRLLVSVFAWSRGRSVVARALSDAVRYRLADRNVTPGERQNLQRLLDRSLSDRAARRRPRRGRRAGRRP